MYSEYPKKLALTLILQYKVKTNYYLTTLASLFFLKDFFQDPAVVSSLQVGVLYD